jgi:hypothetical protein
MISKPQFPKDLAHTAFEQAWEASCKDFYAGLINSEATLVASLYYHLRAKFDYDNGWTIYVEPRFEIQQPNQEQEPQKTKKHPDLVITKKEDGSNQAFIVFAAEVKFTPKGFPIPIRIQKDIETLSYIKNSRDGNAYSLTIKRDTSIKGESKEIRPEKNANRMLVLAIMAGIDNRKFKNRQNFLTPEHKPQAGPWKDGLPSHTRLKFYFSTSLEKEKIKTWSF